MTNSMRHFNFSITPGSRHFEVGRRYLAVILPILCPALAAAANGARIAKPPEHPPSVRAIVNVAPTSAPQANAAALSSGDDTRELAAATSPAAAAALPSSTASHQEGADEAVIVAAPARANDEVADEEGDEAEAEEHAGTETLVPGDNGHLYSSDLSDSELERCWTHDLLGIGSISVGFTDAGRLINGVRMPEGDAWVVVTPDFAWGAQETVDFIATAAREVRAKFPNAPLLRVNHIGGKDGGHLSPHKSHQSGRDVDLGLFYGDGSEHYGARYPERLIDPAPNWELVKALIINTDVQFILLDRRVQAVLYSHALSLGEDPAWLAKVFGTMVKHARRHRDHFHVRFYAGRSQELGRRIHPMLAKRPEKNVMVYRVRSGDSLGRIAQRFKSTVSTIQKANRLSGALVRVGQQLAVPVRGPCTQCPIPPRVIVPPRLLPPKLNEKAEPPVVSMIAPDVAAAEQAQVAAASVEGASAQSVSVGAESRVASAPIAPVGAADQLSASELVETRRRPAVAADFSPGPLFRYRAVVAHESP